MRQSDFRPKSLKYLKKYGHLAHLGNQYALRAGVLSDRCVASQSHSAFSDNFRNRRFNVDSATGIFGG
jgi:hypothetical protein